MRWLRQLRACLFGPRVSHDEEARASYFRIRRALVASTEDTGTSGWVIYDRDRKGRIIGVEVLWGADRQPWWPDTVTSSGTTNTLTYDWRTGGPDAVSSH